MTKRILIVGGDGMLGHQLLMRLADGHDTRVTLRRPLSAYAPLGLFHAENAYDRTDVRDADRVAHVVGEFQPAVVVNAAGVIKQREDAADAIGCIEVNALFPHRLAAICAPRGIRVVHLSTDCVFSGAAGGYTEADRPDPMDVYGRSKLLGEVTGDRCLTLRTSMIGPELHRKKSLLEWFLAESGPVRGFTRAIFSGLTTMELSRVIERLIQDFPNAQGLYHVSAAPISKYALLTAIRDQIGRATNIEPDESVACDRSLNSERFRNAFDYTPPTWEAMIAELCGALSGGRQDPSGNR